VHRRIEKLPPALQHEDFRFTFLSWEHEACLTIHGKRNLLPGDATPDSEDEVGYDDEEGNDMEDVPPATVKMEALVPDDYDEEAATAAALSASKADEDLKWLQDVVEPSAVVAEHVASLPPPPPLPLHASPQVAWDA
jgi:hypothetical protein